MPTINLYNQDCMEAMAKMEDNAFELAIVDPPYGKNADGTQGFATKKTKGFTFERKLYNKKEWDNKTPDTNYFNELKRVSKNQIIWGANYYIKKLWAFDNFIYWHKKGKSEDDKFNEGEIAFVSCGRSRMVDIWWNGFGTINSGEQRFHPTQKPVKLYKWLLKNYASEGNKILDTHLGSGSIAIACHDMGYDLEGYEIDQEYYRAALDRLKTHQSQLQIF